MKITYLATGFLGMALVLTVGSNSVFAKRPTIQIEKAYANPDSLKVEKLAKDLKKIKPITVNEFKAKFKKEVAGFKLTEVDAFEDKDTGSFATANYKKGDQNVYLMVADGAGPGADQVKSSLLNYLEIKAIEELGDKLTIKSYKGWQALFDSSMYESDEMANIQYLEGNRYSIVASGNKTPLEEVKALLDNISL
ncbi:MULTISPECIES: hypothetical protein [Chryseobacterium]|uniref:hypothetical protein n=1 Tax=Chryseobacterium TaxID=59732 RepID=UPI0024E199E6|nr:hypothetical protein [Chryseobacterium sp.]